MRDERFSQLCRSLEADPAFLEQRPILAQADGTVFAGNHRLLAARHLGWATVPAIIADVPDDLAKRRALTDNNNAADWEDDSLSHLLAELQAGATDLSLLGFEDGELERLLDLAGGDGSGEVGEDPGPQLDRAAEFQEKWGAARGDLWLIGRHRLLCGDSTSADDVARLMGGERAALGLHDPPYGIGIVGAQGTAGNFPGLHAPRMKATPIVGDDAPFDPEHLLSMAVSTVLWGANHYADKLSAGSKWLVWDKKDGDYQDADLGDCELAWTNLPGTSRLLHHQWQGMIRESERGVARVHPTQKPVALMEWCMERADIAQGVVVLDCYLGSGTTMVAAEQTGRRCYGMEIEPKYVAVALERLAGMGLEPRRG